MELKDFIKAAITDITEAVSELQDELDNGTVVNPTLPQGEDGKTLQIDNEVRVIERLNFDVAVTISESAGIEGGAKASISIFGAKVGTESSTRTENVSRLTFSIPLVFPSVHVKSPREFSQEKHRKLLSRYQADRTSSQNDTSQAIYDGQDQS